MPFAHRLVRGKRHPQFVGIIYIHWISDGRLIGTPQCHFEDFRELCGDTTLKNVTVINVWREDLQIVGEACKRKFVAELFKPVVDEGAQLLRHHNTAQSAYNIIRSIMKNKPVLGEEDINKEPNEQIRRHQQELRAIQEEMVKVLKEKEEEMRREFEAETRKLREQMSRVRKDLESMASNQEEKRRMGEMVKQVQEQARKEREQAEAAHKQEIDEVKRRFQDNVCVAERRAIFEKETRELREHMEMVFARLAPHYH